MYVYDNSSEKEERRKKLRPHSADDVALVFRWAIIYGTKQNKPNYVTGKSYKSSLQRHTDRMHAFTN